MESGYQVRLRCVPNSGRVVSALSVFRLIPSELSVRRSLPPTVLTREDLCVAILCGAPCSGKSEATRRMAAIFGDLIAVVSDDLACDAQQAPDCKVLPSNPSPPASPVPPQEVYPQSEFDAVIRSLPQKPRVVVYDDSNVQFQNRLFYMPLQPFWLPSQRRFFCRKMVVFLNRPQYFGFF